MNWFVIKPRSWGKLQTEYSGAVKQIPTSSHNQVAELSGKMRDIIKLLNCINLKLNEFYYKKYNEHSEFITSESLYYISDFEVVNGLIFLHGGNTL